MQTLIGVAVRATFLAGCVLVAGMAVHTRQALPAEADDGFNAPQVVNSAAKSDRAGVVPAQAQPAQPSCGPRVKVVAALTEKFGEVRRAMGLVSQTSIVELYVSPKGSWTALVTTSDGQSCIVAAGQHWSEMPKPKPTGPEARNSETPGSPQPASAAAGRAVPPLASDRRGDLSRKGAA